jgi:hypothetical protein
MIILTDFTRSAFKYWYRLNLFAPVLHEYSPFVDDKGYIMRNMACVGSYIQVVLGLPRFAFGMELYTRLNDGAPTNLCDMPPVVKYSQFMHHIRICNSR